MTKEEGIKEIDRLAKEHGVVYILFENMEAADQFMKEMRAAHALKMRMDALGIEMPKGVLQ